MGGFFRCGCGFILSFLRCWDNYWFCGLDGALGTTG